MSRAVRLGSLRAVFFFFQAEDGIRDYKVTGVQTCALPISPGIASVLHVSPAEAAFDAEIAARHGVLEGRRHLDDLVVLDVQAQRASDAAVSADGVHAGLPALVPGAGLPAAVLPLEHESPRRADGEAG